MQRSDPSDTAAPKLGRRWRVAVPVCLAALVAAGTFVRTQTAVRQSTYDTKRPERMLKSDPALLYYITQRIVDHGGLPPADFRADPRIEHPELTDIPATFTVGIEFLVAWAYLLVGDGIPLHLFCTAMLALLASLCVIGVFGLAHELTRDLRWALLAALLYTVTLTNYRTIAFILIREDLSLPLFASHLWLLARYARKRTVAALVGASILLVAALASWHAMRFVVAIEAACFLAWFVRTRQNPLAQPRSWLLVGIAAMGCLSIPVLYARVALLSAPLVVAGALMATALVARSSLGRRVHPVVVCLAALAALLGVRYLAAGGQDYAHVASFLEAKLLHGGVRPNDPTDLSVGARILWQGPFSGGSVAHLLTRLGMLGALLPVSLLLLSRQWLWRPQNAAVALLAAFGVASLVSALLIVRLSVLVGIVAPVLGVVLLQRVRGVPTWTWVIGLAVAQLLLFRAQINSYDMRSWYHPMEQRVAGESLTWIKQHVPRDAAFVADYVSSAAVLAIAGNPIVIQPKYESQRTQERIAVVVNGLYHDSPRGLHCLLRRRFEARYLLVDVVRLWNWRYAAGLPLDAAKPPQGSAAAAFLHSDPERFTRVPGFRLVHQALEQQPLWRVYEIVELQAGSSCEPDLRPLRGWRPGGRRN